MSDVFVALPSITNGGCMIFGKNADRPKSEVQEVIYEPAVDHPEGSTLECTFLDIAQACHVHAVILSKPAWAWGAEMGANEKGVCIGNTAAWTKSCRPGDSEQRLIGVDFVRLGLERGDSAKETLGVITGLLEKYGQGGPCCEDETFSDWMYHNSYLIADRTEAWVLDTAGSAWAAKRITDGFHNISSQLSIGCDADEISSNAKDLAINAGWYQSDAGEFHFANIFSATESCSAVPSAESTKSRLTKGRQLLENLTKDGTFNIELMFQILRDEDSHINMVDGDLVTMASQVTVLSQINSSKLDTHWLTATQNPKLSVFKPFLFGPNAILGLTTRARSSGDRARAIFRSGVNRQHPLGKAHIEGMITMKSDNKGRQLLDLIQTMETQCIHGLGEFLNNFDETQFDELHDLFKDVAESEMKFYR